MQQSAEAHVLMRAHVNLALLVVLACRFLGPTLDDATDVNELDSTGLRLAPRSKGPKGSELKYLVLNTSRHSPLHEEGPAFSHSYIWNSSSAARVGAIMLTLHEAHGTLTARHHYFRPAVKRLISQGVIARLNHPGSTLMTLQRLAKQDR